MLTRPGPAQTCICTDSDTQRHLKCTTTVERLHHSPDISRQLLILLRYRLTRVQIVTRFSNWNTWDISRPQVIGGGTGGALEHRAPG